MLLLLLLLLLLMMMMGCWLAAWRCSVVCRRVIV
jgi:hypothetical protein